MTARPRLAAGRRVPRALRHVAVVLAAAALLAGGLYAHLIERGAPGCIVNVGSRGAYRGEPDHPAYGAAKAALHAFGQSMAVALAPHGISVTSVAPGFISTDRQQAALDGPEGRALLGQSPFGRVGPPHPKAHEFRDILAHRPTEF